MAALLAVVAGPATAGPVAAEPAPVDAANVDTTAADGVEGRYIVRFREGASRRVGALSTGDGIEVERVYDHVFDGFAARLDHAALTRLRRDPDVARVTPVQPISVEPVTDVPDALDVATGTTSTASQVDPPSWGLDRVDQRMLPLDGTFAPHGSGDGSGVRIYVVDSGIYADHQEFAGRLAPGIGTVGADGGFVEEDTGTDDCHGHGTHVAGTAAGTEHGVAKAATIVPVRVLDCEGKGDSRWLLAGFNWILANHPAGSPGVVNVSLGGSGDIVIDEAIQELVDAGLVVVAAAGNEGRDACLGSPGRAPEAITVGASDRGDRMPGFSNDGSCVDLFAPGVSIMSAGIAHATHVREDHGTSMATPHVSGAAALLLSDRPDATPTEVADELTAGATVGAITLAGAGSPDRLLHLGDPTDPSPTPPPNDDLADAAVLTLPQPAPWVGHNLYASVEPGEPQHAAVPGGRSVWFTFTAPEDGIVTLTTAGSYPMDTVMGLYAGTSVAALTEVAADDDGGPGYTSRIVQYVPASRTYHLAVDGYLGQMGPVHLDVGWAPGADPCTGPDVFIDVPASHAFCPDIAWLAATGITSGYSDGGFRPSAAVSRQAMAAFLHRAVAPTFTPPAVPSFADVPTHHPFYRQVEWLAGAGIASGYPDGTFRPTADVTRQATAAFFHRLQDPGDVGAATGFPDVPGSHPFAEQIAWLADAGVASGYPDGTFRPSADVTRQAAAAFLHRLDRLPG